MICQSWLCLECSSVLRIFIICRTSAGNWHWAAACRETGLVEKLWLSAERKVKGHMAIPDLVSLTKACSVTERQQIVHRTWHIFLSFRQYLTNWQTERHCVSKQHTSYIGQSAELKIFWKGYLASVQPVRQQPPLVLTIQQSALHFHEEQPLTLHWPKHPRAVNTRTSLL